MSYKFNPFTGTLDVIDGIFNVPLYGSAPSSPVEGQMYINTSDNTMYVYYSSNWQVLHVLSVINSYLLLENGDYLLLESGDKIIL